MNVNLNDRLIEQMEPILDKLHDRLECTPSDHDDKVISYAMVAAAMMGARVCWAALVASLDEGGVNTSELVLLGTAVEDEVWPDA